MITDLLLNIIKGLIDWMMAGLPTWDCTMPEGSGSFVGAMKGFNDWLPIQEVLTVCSLFVTAVLLITGLKWTVKVIDWIADVIP